MTQEDAVMQAEQARCAAMLANDAAALSPLLSDGITFVHATGAADDKRVLLEKVKAGGIVYHAINWSEPKIDIRDSVAAMSGVMTLEVTVAGVDKSLRNRVILLWENTNGGWRLFHFQSTPIAQPR